MNLITNADQFIFKIHHIFIYQPTKPTKNIQIISLHDCQSSFCEHILNSPWNDSFWDGKVHIVIGVQIPLFTTK